MSSDDEAFEIYFYARLTIVRGHYVLPMSICPLHGKCLIQSAPPQFFEPSV